MGRKGGSEVQMPAYPYRIGSGMVAGLNMSRAHWGKKVPGAYELQKTRSEAENLSFNSFPRKPHSLTFIMAYTLSGNDFMIRMSPQKLLFLPY